MVGAKCGDEDEWEQWTQPRAWGTGTGRKCRQKAQELTQTDSSEGEAVSFQAVGGRGSRRVGWGRTGRGFRPALVSSGGPVSLGHLHLIIHLFIYSFINSLCT